MNLTRIRALNTTAVVNRLSVDDHILECVMYMGSALMALRDAKNPGLTSEQTAGLVLECLARTMLHLDAACARRQLQPFQIMQSIEVWGDVKMSGGERAASLLAECRKTIAPMGGMDLHVSKRLALSTMQPLALLYGNEKLMTNQLPTMAGKIVVMMAALAMSVGGSLDGVVEELCDDLERQQAENKPKEPDSGDREAAVGSAAGEEGERKPLALNRGD